MTKRGMPSAAQMRVLRAALAAGDGGLCGDQWWAIPTTEQTRRAVRLAGWIERVDDLGGDGLPNTTWLLTNLGRHALEAGIITLTERHGGGTTGAVTDRCDDGAVINCPHCHSLMFVSSEKMEELREILDEWDRDYDRSTFVLRVLLDSLREGLSSTNEG